MKSLQCTDARTFFVALIDAGCYLKLIFFRFRKKYQAPSHVFKVMKWVVITAVIACLEVVAAGKLNINSINT